MNPKTKTFNRAEGEQKKTQRSCARRAQRKKMHLHKIFRIFFRSCAVDLLQVIDLDDRPSITAKEKNAPRTRENQCQKSMQWFFFFIPNLPLASFCSINMFYEANGAICSHASGGVCVCAVTHAPYRCLVRPAATWSYRYHRNGCCLQTKKKNEIEIPKKWWPGRNIEKNEQQIKLNGRKKYPTIRKRPKHMCWSRRGPHNES